MATHEYLPKIRRYLETLQQYASTATPYLGAVACDPTETLAGLDLVRAFCVPPGMLARSLGNPGNGCIQHGNWLPYLPVTDDETVVICTDGDVKMQRNFSQDEWSWLMRWEHGQVGIGNNEPRPGGDTMDNELVRIQPLLSRDELARRFYPDPTVSPPIGNAGCIVATRRTWAQLWMRYLALWTRTAPLFGHIAVQQWTINLAIAQAFTRIELPPLFHTHGHWGYPGEPYGGWGEGDVATYEGQPILFAHKTW